MNISKLTMERLNAKTENKSPAPVEEPQKLPEPVTNVAEFFSKELSDLNNPFIGDQEKFLIYKKNEVKEVSVYDSVTLSNLFRQCRYDLRQEQVKAFEGIESLREYVENTNCNCQGKLAQINQYYRDFVLGNSQTDLFPSMKEALKLDKIIFFYENQKIFEI